MIIKKFPEDFIVKEIINFPKENGEYAYYVLWKRNLSTLRAIKIIKRKLRISRYRISFAGEKDKKAITEQYISIKNFEGKDFYDFGNVKLKFVGNFSEPVSTALLLGNRFKIVVREVNTEEREEFYKVKDILIKNGFPNYFDEQRFGDIRCINHLVGLALLKRNYEEACKIILTHLSEKENPKAYKARKFLKENWGKFSEALKLFPKYLDIETSILNHLAKKPNDFKGALKRLHKKLLRLFIHSVQSYIFNITLSKYIEQTCKNLKYITFSFGKLAFPYECKIKRIVIPLIGFKTDLEKYDETKDTITHILEDLGIRLEDFFFENFSILSSEGSERKAFEDIKDFKYKESDNTFILEFFLPKGSYATIVIKYLFKLNS